MVFHLGGLAHQIEKKYKGLIEGKFVVVCFE